MSTQEDALEATQHIPDLSKAARDALLAAIYCEIVTDIYRVRVGDGSFDWFISGQVGERELWLTPAEWQRDHARLLKASVRS